MTDDGRLEALVRRYEEAWERGDGADLGQLLPPEGDPLRGAALHALIDSDLHIRWRRGQSIRLEEYLQRFPELGTARSVPAVLILAEFRARTAHGDRPALDVYERRFPDQFPEVERLARDGALLEDRTMTRLTMDVPAAPPPAKPPPAGPSFVPVSGGYKLLKRIGSGGFAEVWLAEAPGGFPAAVKMIFRPLEHDEAQRELKALEVVHRFTHPYLLQTQAAWVQEGRLYVAMELAEGSLRDRLRECRKAGLPGVPLDELLRYFHEAAEALDYLHSEKVQHRDIKPDNILLLKGHAKVGDFGLARLQEKAVAVTASTSGTPLYMPPEVWEGKMHPHSDQYSLAISYIELRIDRRPFVGASPAEIMMAHLDSRPDLEPLGAPEQQVLQRALARDPGRRFGSCSEFVRALAAALPQELETARQRVAAGAGLPSQVFDSLPGGNLSGPPTDGNSLVSVSRQGPTDGLSDTSLGRTPVMTPPVAPRAPARRRPLGSLPVMAALLLGIPLLGALVVVGARSFGKGRGDVARDGSSGRDDVPKADAAVDWLPAGCRPAAGHEGDVAVDGGKRYYRRIERLLPDGTPVPFVLITQDQGEDPEGRTVRPFYIMVDKVSVDLFTRFAAARGAALKNNQWQTNPWQQNRDGAGRLPIMNVKVVDALQCAKWLGGNLPTRKEWDKAAGLYDARPGRVYPPPQTEGPYRTGGAGADRQPVAVGRAPEEGPVEMVDATADEARSGCRYMAGNGREWTRSLALSDEEVPILDRTPTKDDLVTVRGRTWKQAVGKDRPLTFTELRKDIDLDSDDYELPQPDVGFRVVIEAPAS